jgi:hypothetical protein
VGLGAGGALAGRGWEQWGDLDTAANAGASDAGQIVTRGQADAAFTGAVIDSAFAFLDLIPAARIARVAATTRRGLPAAARTGAESLPAGSLDEAMPGLPPSVRGGDDAIGPGVRHGAGGDIAQAGARTGQDTAMRLRPYETANWGELKRKYIGKKLDEVGAPPGYGEVRGAGGSSLRRAVANDALEGRLSEYRLVVEDFTGSVPERARSRGCRRRSSVWWRGADAGAGQPESGRDPGSVRGGRRQRAASQRHAEGGPVSASLCSMKSSVHSGPERRAIAVSYTAVYQPSCFQA